MKCTRRVFLQRKMKTPSRLLPICFSQNVFICDQNLEDMALKGFPVTEQTRFLKETQTIQATRLTFDCC